MLLPTKQKNQKKDIFQGNNFLAAWDGGRWKVRWPEEPNEALTMQNSSSATKGHATWLSMICFYILAWPILTKEASASLTGLALSSSVWAATIERHPRGLLLTVWRPDIQGQGPGRSGVG